MAQQVGSHKKGLSNRKLVTSLGAESDNSSKRSRSREDE